MKQSDKALVIKAKGGLGNRMLSAVTGIALAQLNNRTPIIDWRDGMYVESGENLYPFLFDASWMAAASSRDDAADPAPSIWAGRMSDHPVDIIRQNFPNDHQNPFIYRKLSIAMNGADPDVSTAVFWSYLPKLKRLEKRLSRHPRFAGRSIDTITSELLDQYFTPVPEVRSQVDAVFDKIDGPVIGLHIRFTDRKAPLPKIIDELSRLKTREPNTTIFLATDSEEAQKAVLEKFEDVVTIDKALSNDSSALHFSSEGFSDPVVEARNALIDMTALSKCDWLLHSRHSTFSVTAALMGRIPNNRQIDVERYNPKLALKQFFQARA